MSRLLTRMVDRTKTVLGDFVLVHSENGEKIHNSACWRSRIMMRLRILKSEKMRKHSNMTETISLMVKKC